MAGRQGRRGFGHVRKLPSGRWQASYLGPDGIRHTARTPEGAPMTFDAKIDAVGWLSIRQAEILRGAWLPPAEPAPAVITLGRYAEAWLADRDDLAARTRDHYEQMLRNHILPALGAAPLGAITPAAVKAWHAGLAEATGPTMRAHAYGLLRTILGTAASDGLIPANPCRIRGAGQVKRAKVIRTASLAELETIAAAMPPRYRLMVELAAWCGLRFGELAELRRRDIDLGAQVVRIRRGVVTTAAGRAVKEPKSEAGSRDVTIPPHLIPAIRGHLDQHAGRGRDALLFPAASGGHMAASSLHKVFRPARAKAGRPDLRFHDLRHTGATMAAQTGATLAELMDRLGHSTVTAAMRYQHAADERRHAIAAALTRMHGAEVVALRPRAPRPQAARKPRKTGTTGKGTTA
jgi:integrase